MIVTSFQACALGLSSLSRKPRFDQLVVEVSVNIGLKPCIPDTDVAEDSRALYGFTSHLGWPIKYSEMGINER